MLYNKKNKHIKTASNKGMRFRAEQINLKTCQFIVFGLKTNITYTFWINILKSILTNKIILLIYFKKQMLYNN